MQDDHGYLWIATNTGVNKFNPATVEEVTTMEASRIIIVGSGFAGVTLADHLTRRVVRDVEVVVISSENHMVFTPMLAEVAGRSLSGLDVVMPGRQIAPRPPG